MFLPRSSHPAAVAAVACCALTWLGSAPAARQATPLRSGIELITIDATVVDQDGRPVTDLTPADIDVTVDGKPRRVAALRYVDLTARLPQGPQAGPAPRLSLFSTNDPDASSSSTERTIVLAVDHGSFLSGRGRQTLETARAFLAQLDPAERVALAAYPDPGFLLPPSAGREAILRALERITGTGVSVGSPSPIMAISISEAAEIAAGNTLTHRRVSDRTCEGYSDTTGRETCRQEVQRTAVNMVQALQAQSVRSLAGLSGILGGLRALDGRKQVVLVSAGLFHSGDRNDRGFVEELRRTTALAATASVTIRALHVEAAVLEGLGSDRGRTDASLMQDKTVMAQGLDALAAANGGSVTRLTADASGAFGRIGRELAGCYELAVEAEDADRDGRLHTIRLRLARRGVQVRHRQQFAVAAAGTAGASVEANLVAVLQAGQIRRALPVRVSTRSFQSQDGKGLRVLVRADIGRDASEPAELYVLSAVFDARGTVVGSSSGAKRLEPPPVAGGSWPYIGMFHLRPGPHTLRVAVADAAGRIGSVAHAFVATLTPGTGARFSDLLVVDATRTSDTEFVHSVDLELAGRTITAVVDAYPDPGVTISGVTFLVSSGASGPPLATAAAALSAQQDGSRVTAMGQLDLSALPPGEYVLTAHARAGETRLGSVSVPIALVGME